MDTEIFRFSIIRNPQAISQEKLADSTVNIIDENEKNYPTFVLLKRLRSKEPIEKIIEEASIEMRKDHFLNSPSKLHTEIHTFDNWLLSQKSINGSEVHSKAQALFGDLQKMIDSEEFKHDKYKISDSLIVVSVTEPPVNGLRSQLMRLRRIVFLIENLAKEEGKKVSSKKVRSILRATVLLPSQLFPLPNQNEERSKKNKEDQKRKREKIKKRVQEINNLNEQIERSNEAIDELTKTYSLHLLELRNNPKLRNKRKLKLSLLPTEKFNKLKETTKSVVTKTVGLKGDMVDVPFAVKAIEDEITTISKKINFDKYEIDAFNPADTAVMVEGSCGACRMVVLEDEKLANNFTGKTKGYVNHIENQDLMMVRQELLDYKAGEIAHIENVLKGETKSRKHRKLDRTEETIFEETEREEEFENDLETTDRFELQSETAKTISRDVSKEAGVTVAYGGPVKVEAHGNYASNTATEDSRRSASTYSKDVVSRSVQKIKERVLTRRTRTTTSEVEVINKHKIDNSQPPAGGDGSSSGHINGIYKWVNKLYKAQIFNYGKRGILEFMIPEPAAFYRYAMNKKPVEYPEVPKPDEPGFCKGGVFSKLKPTDLSVSNYMCFVSKYGVSDVTPPPPRFVVQSGATSLHFKSESSKVQAGDKIEPITIPTSYKAVFAKYNLAAGRGHSQSGPDDDSEDNTKANFGVKVTLGNHLILTKELTENKDDNGRGDKLDDKFPFDSELSLDKIEENIALDNEEGTINIGIAYSSDINFYAILNVAITCERKPEAFQQWQIDTYTAIINAYNGLKLDYEESLQAQSFETEINIQGQNPLINREVEKTELKKHAISILTGQQYEGFNAMWQNLNQRLGYPEIDLEDAAEEGRFVQFFEQAFEWQHATYLFYDYFWGRKDHWIETLHLKDTDPLFERFLKAGYARLWVPIRPGFGEVVGHYVCAGGQPWMVKPAPICKKDGEKIELEGGYGQNPFVPLIEELKEQLDNEFVERSGKIEATKDSNEIQGKEDTDFSLDDIDREILIDLKSYRIAAVDVAAQTIKLDRPFEGETATFGVALGATYVGEPWIVKVPTSLVWLDESEDLKKVSSI